MKKKILIAVLILGMIGTVSANQLHDFPFDELSSPSEDNLDGDTITWNGGYDVDGDGLWSDGDAVYYEAGTGEGDTSFGPGLDQDHTFIWMMDHHFSNGGDACGVSNDNLFSTGAGCSGGYIISLNDAGDVEWQSDGNPKYLDTNFPDSGTHTLALTFDGNTMRAYVDGEFKDSISYYGAGDPNNPGSGGWFGGVDADVHHFAGFDQQLSQTEVQSYHNCGDIDGCVSIDSVSKNPTDPSLTDLVDVQVNTTGADTVTGSWSRDGTTQSSGDSFTSIGTQEWEIQNWINISEADSTYSYTLTATTSTGASTTYTDSFTVSDSTAGLKAAKPKNNTAYQDPVEYDVYLNNDGDDVENETASCTLYADGSQFASFTLTEGGAHETGNLPSLSEGSHNFEASCTEDQGISALEDVYREFTVDDTKPSLNITSPTGKLEIKNNIDLNYTVSDSSPLAECKYNIDGGSNVTLPSCNNAQFSVNEVGDHTLNLYAIDQAGNTQYDSELFTADYRNTIELEDRDTGSSIQEFQVVLSNGDTTGGSTSDGVYEFYTTEMPKGDVNMTIKSDGYQTRTIEFSDVDQTFELRNTYSMTRAGVYIDAIDEQTQEDLRFSFTARNSTTSFNKTNITEYDIDLKNVQDFPRGDVTLTVTHPDDTYRPRQYFLTVNENTRTMLTAYLLERGQGLFTSVEVVDGQQNAIQGSLVNIQKLYGTQWKTVAQKETTSSGGQSFYLDPDISYRAYVTHPNYVAFQGTFSPANYQYEPLIIQLGTSDAYNFTTRWDSISYKIEPQTQTLEGEGSQTFNYTVMDSQNALTEFGLKFWHNGTKLNQDSVKDSPSGGTVSLTEALGKYSDGERVKVEGYFLSDGDYYSVNRTYIVRKGFDQGVFSINAIFYELKQSLDETGEAFVALIATFLTVLGTRKTQFTNATMDGALALLVLGIFTWKQMFPGFIFILTLLLLIGVWASRRV